MEAIELWPGLLWCVQGPAALCTQYPTQASEGSSFPSCESERPRPIKIVQAQVRHKASRSAYWQRTP